MSTHNVPPESASSTIRHLADKIVKGIGQQVESRAYRASNELANGIAYVMRGMRSGRRYSIPGVGRVKYHKRGKKKGTATVTYKKYTASAPGESPAIRTGAFRASWKRRVYAEPSANGKLFYAVTESDYKVGSKGNHLLGNILEYGTEDGRIAPRPYKEKVLAMALPRIKRIYKEPYTR